MKNQYDFNLVKKHFYDQIKICTKSAKLTTALLQKIPTELKQQALKQLQQSFKNGQIKSQYPVQQLKYNQYGLDAIKQIRKSNYNLIEKAQKNKEDFYKYYKDEAGFTLQEPEAMNQMN